MLVELAVGDAYGAGFEFCDPTPPERPNDLSRYVDNASLPGLGRGRYTDDAQMALAVAEAILADDPWTAASLSRRFVDVYRRDPRAGYSRRTKAALDAALAGADFLSALDRRSESSGAAMRAAPIGVFPSEREVIGRARFQARLTHDTPAAADSAAAAALAAHYFLYRKGPRVLLPAYLERWVPGLWTRAHRGPVSVSGLDAVRAAVTAVARYDRLSDILTACIAFTGDVDTVAAIAMAAAAHARDIVQDLPAGLLEGLENGAFGRDHLARVDAALLARAAAA